MGDTRKDDKWLHAYLDGELSVEKSLEMEDYLQADPQAREELEKMRALKNRLARVMSQEPLPSHLESALRQKIRQPSENISSTHNRERPFPWGWAAAAAIFLLAINLPAILRPPEPETYFLTYAEKSHQRYVQARRPEVMTSNLSQTISQFNRLFQASWTPSSLNIPKAQFKGWCNCYIQGIQDVRRLAYEMDGVPVSLYVCRNANEIPCPGLSSIHSNGRLYLIGLCGNYRVVKWQSGALSYVLISELPEDRMLNVMNQLEF